MVRSLQSPGDSAADVAQLVGWASEGKNVGVLNMAMRNQQLRDIRIAIAGEVSQVSGVANVEFYLYAATPVTRSPITSV